tara:strand:+ start:591 stop:1274 length:684 start_codon:yes stop_codon:yes gene_type:complete
MSTGIIRHGAIPWEDVPYDIEFDAFGVGASTIHVQYEFNDPASAANKISGILTHPTFQWLKRTKAKIQREEANSAKASITFEGIPPNTDEKHYKLKGSLATENIESHPDFQDWIDEGIVEVNDKNEVETWLTGPGDDFDFTGIESWLVPNLIYEETWIRGAKGGARDFSKLGKKENPPDSDARPGNIGSTREFLFIGGDIELIGYGSKMTRRWRLSGPRGWSDKIYG